MSLELGTLLQQYDSKLDIVYQNALGLASTQEYKSIIYWNSTTPVSPNSSRSRFENSKRRFVEPLPSSSYISCFSNFSHHGQLQGFSQTKTSQTQKINLSCALISQQWSLQTQLFLFLFVDNLNLLKRSGSYFRKKAAFFLLLI